MTSAWISAIGGILIRSNTIEVIQHAADGLYADTITGRHIKLAESACSYVSQLQLLEEIRRAEVDDRYTVLLIPEDEDGDLKWKRTNAIFELK